MINFAEEEKKILEFWEKDKTFAKSLAKDSPKGEYVFYEGPPTANGRPGTHHVLARAFKDVLPRYKTMNGYRVLRKAGWDTHGLPVELQVEKELNISGRLEIEKYGIEKFNAKCRDSVWQFKDEWEKLTERIAFWVDMEEPYITYENNYIESVWWIIKQIYDKELIYKGYKVVPHCSRCGTTLSSHEVSQGYKNIKENSVYLNFKVTKGNNKVKVGDIILAWTTTPWTLPGNVALAVGKDIDYVKVKYKGDNYLLAKARLSIIDGEYEVIDEFEGSELLNLEYKPLFDVKTIKETGQKAYYVLPADFVTTEDGTGIVHTAVMYGEDDYNLGIEAGLPACHTVTEQGNFSEDLANYKLAGKFVKDDATEKTILEHLREQGLLFKEELYEHDYPFCWRCESPLLYYAKDSWFIKMSALKEKLIENNNSINWVPSHIKTGRFGEWLENVKDWALSRERYWGTPLPIWSCQKCDKTKCIGSIKELGVKLDDPHRPYIDGVKFKCDCGGEMIRDKSVLDCWFDSGAMPFAQYHYPFENKELIDNNEQFPADYICEAIDQTRGWFYTLLGISTLLDKGTSYKNVICLGHINDKHGKKMSKSKGNIIDPWKVINQFGVDAMRMHMYTINQPGEGKNYDLSDVKSVLQQNVMTLWNVYKFYEMYSNDDDISSKPKAEHVLDQWILLRTDQLTNKISGSLEKYHVYEAAREIPLFINDLSTWYLRRSRDRFKGGDKVAIQTMGYVLLQLSKLTAPFMPFIAEKLWQSVTNNNFKNSDKSVHLEDWPQVDEFSSKQETALLRMAEVRKVVEKAHAARDEAGIKVRQPLGKLKVSARGRSAFGGKNLKFKVEEEYINLIKDEVNVKEVVIDESISEDVVLDTKLTPELEQEGLLRDLVRQINFLRKKAGLTINDRVKVVWQSNEAMIKDVFVKFDTELKQQVLADDIKEDDTEINTNDTKKNDGVISEEVKVGNNKVSILLVK